MVSTELLAEDPDTDPTEGGLIRNGRYMVWYPGEKKPRALTRVTNYAKTLEDTFTLMAWQQRMVAVGLTHREDLRVQVAACSLDERQELNKLCEAAKDAAKANAKRDTGSALHKLAERVDRGEDFPIPEPWDADIAAYRQALELAGVEILGQYIEGVVVHANPDLAGRFDRIVRHGDGLKIADMKTGQDLSYSWGSIAIQLHLYATAESIYDHATRTHLAMPAVDQATGLVFHVPSESGRCDIYEVDITEGNFGAVLVDQVQTYRKRARTLATLLPILSPASGTADSQDETGDAGPVTQPASPELRAYVTARVQAIVDFGAKAKLAKAWPEDLPTLKSFDAHSEDQLDAILAVCTKVEADSEMPFPTVDDPRTLTPPPEPKPAPPAPVDLEGPAAPAFEVEATRIAFDELSDDQRETIGAIVAEARLAGGGIAVKTHPSWRRLHIARALLAGVVADIPEPHTLATLVRACLVPVIGEMQEAIPTGAYLDALTPDEAERFYRLISSAYGTGNVLIGWDDTGAHLIGAVA